MARLTGAEAVGMEATDVFTASNVARGSGALGWLAAAGGGVAGAFIETEWFRK